MAQTQPIPQPKTDPFIGNLRSVDGDEVGNFTLENVCDLLPKQICELRAPCCNSSGVGFDRYYCEAQVHDHCVHNTAAVAAGDMTFKPEYLGPCLLEWQRLAAGCDTLAASFFASVVAG